MKKIKPKKLYKNKPPTRPKPPSFLDNDDPIVD